MKVTQEDVILACRHATAPGYESDTRLADGRRVHCCCQCWNASVAVRRRILKEELEEAKETGRQFWAAQGIVPGQKVKRFAISWFGLGGETVYGIAKVGRCGAYVSSKFQSGKLTRHGWEAVE